MRFSIRSLFFGLLALIGGGCGDSGGDKVSEKEFGQVVDKINYQIKELDLTIELQGRDGGNDIGREVIQKKLRYDTAGSKDLIQRLIEGSSFILVVNEQKSDVKVSSGGNIDHLQTIEEKAPGCSLEGESHVAGVSSSLDFELKWELDMSLDGSTCDGMMLEKYFKFQDREVEAFHLKAVKDAIASADLARNLQRKMKLRLKVVGESN